MLRKHFSIFHYHVLTQEFELFWGKGIHIGRVACGGPVLYQLVDGLSLGIAEFADVCYQLVEEYLMHYIANI